MYVGSTVRKNPLKRWWRHTKDLRNGVHHSRHLQRAWNKYGSSNFQFMIVELVADENILITEQKYLTDRKENYQPKLNYNECWVAGNCSGRKFSKESILKLKKSHLGIRPSLSTREKQSLVWDGKCQTPYSFTDPTGKIYEGVLNLRRFGREHGLNSQTLKRMYDGKMRYYKGWTKTGIPLPMYELVSPSGNRYNGYILKKLCMDHKVNYKMIHKCCIKQKKPYKGWIAFRKK